jgi:putative O-methyltransferase
MSGGTSVPYNLRQNKHVERRLFVDLLDCIDRWRPLKNYLYVGFGGIYFEDFKMLHSHFAIHKMLSIESEKWVLPRQKQNIPYGCIDHEHSDSGEFIRTVDKYRDKYKADNLICWLDYASPTQLASQLNDVKALLPSLMPNDILKVTLVADPYTLATTAKAGEDIHEKRLEILRQRLGTQFLSDGLTAEQVREDRYPEVLLGSFRRVVAEAMKESSSLIFQPLGSYVYRDTTQMLTITGIVIETAELDSFMKQTALKAFDLAGLDWQLQQINVPDLSLREKLLLDRTIFNKTASEIETAMQFQLDEDAEDSIRMIESYMKFYRYYPNFHRVVV